MVLVAYSYSYNKYCHFCPIDVFSIFDALPAELSSRLNLLPKLSLHSIHAKGFNAKNSFVIKHHVEEQRQHLYHKRMRRWWPVCAFACVRRLKIPVTLACFFVECLPAFWNFFALRAINLMPKKTSLGMGSEPQTPNGTTTAVNRVPNKNEIMQNGPVQVPISSLSANWLDNWTHRNEGNKPNLLKNKITTCYRRYRHHVLEQLY